MSTSGENAERFSRLGDGRFAVALPEEERTLLAALPHELLVALEALGEHGETPSALARLFPDAHPRDEVESRRFSELQRPELTAAHLEALELLVERAHATVLEEAELDGWLRAIGDLRLVLGSSLEVTEEVGAPDPQSPRFAEWLCYHYLSAIQAEIVEVLLKGLGPPLEGADESTPEDPWGEPLGDLRWDGTLRPDR